MIKTNTLVALTGPEFCFIQVIGFIDKWYSRNGNGKQMQIYSYTKSDESWLHTCYAIDCWVVRSEVRNTEFIETEL